MKIKNLTAISAALVATMASHAPGAITVNDIIVIDIGKNDLGNETPGNWNNISGSGSAQFGNAGTLISDLVRFSDGAGTGVSITVAAPSSGAVGIGGADVTSIGAGASFSETGVIPDSAQIDVLFVNNSSVTLTFSGLDDSLTYSAEILSLFDGGRNAQDISIGGVAQSVDPNEAPYVIAYNDLTTDGSGNLVVEFSSAGGGANLQHINAIQLIAIPEPSVCMLGSLALAGLLVRRRK
ncbi:MAG: hypothetical protein Q7Q71_13840 [Verrucomicrobiota bacterium JB023]|nr:hypothetical protein [Verrucomicrobiota bacterium JB023]